MNQMNCMIDLETLGRREDAVVLSLGAVLFTPERGFIDKFYTVFNVQEQLEQKRSVHWGTINFWLENEKTFKDLATVINDSEVGVAKQLNYFLHWLEKPRKIGGSFDEYHDYLVKPWGNGPTFDITILENLLRQYGRDFPWNFWDVRCMRTFREYVGKNEKVEKTGTLHNALDDAEAQAEYVIKHLK